MTDKKETKEENTMEVLKSDKIETKVTNLKQLVQNKLESLKDLATMELLLPIDARLKNRMKSIKELTSAQHIKVEGQWKTIPPKMHITKFTGYKHNNNEAVIEFEVYETDSKGNKKITQHSTKVEDREGRKFDRVTSAEYSIAYKVRETIIKGKPITREIIQIKGDQE